MATTKGFDVNIRLLTTGVTLIGTAMLLTAAGLGVTTAALVAASRRYVQRMETPPRQLAQLKWTRAKSATGAGIDAWRSAERSSEPVALAN